MSGRGEIEQRFQRLREISGIMTAMKSLSLVETRKLARFIGHQQRMLANIEAAASDFLHFFPAEIAAKTEGTILLLVGSERGFCGNCGSPVAFFYDDLPDVWVKIGSLDHPEDWPMTREAPWGRCSHLHVDTKVPWHEINDELPQRVSYRDKI